MQHRQRQQQRQQFARRPDTELTKVVKDVSIIAMIVVIAIVLIVVFSVYLIVRFLSSLVDDAGRLVPSIKCAAWLEARQRKMSGRPFDWAGVHPVVAAPPGAQDPYQSQQYAVPPDQDNAPPR